MNDSLFARALRIAADELDRLSNERDDELLREIKELHASFRQHRLREGIRYTAMQRTIIQLKEMIMPLQPEVQALVDQVAANTSAEASSAAAMTALSGQVETLTKQLAAVVPGAPISPDDLAAIVEQTATLKASLDALTPAIPANVTPDTPDSPAVPVDPAVVEAAATVGASVPEPPKDE